MIKPPAKKGQPAGPAQPRPGKWEEWTTIDGGGLEAKESKIVICLVDLLTFHQKPEGSWAVAQSQLIGWIILNQVLRVECARWSVDRLVLLGDAAHAMAPNLGQGANSALVDAAVLLDELRRHPTRVAALAAYHSRRAPAVRWVATTAARLGSLSERTDPVTRWLRDRIVMPLTASRQAALAPRVLQETPDSLRAITAP